MDKINYKQLGNSGLTRYGNYIYEEFLHQLRWPGAAKIYKEMSDNDPVIGAILYLAEMQIRNVAWTVKPVSDKPADKEAAEFLESVIHDMEVSWDDTICEILSMMPYGFSFHEVVYKVRRGPKASTGKYKSKYNDGRIAWRRLPIRAQSSLFGWDFDEDGDIKAFIQQGPPDWKLVTIPLDKGLLFRTRISKDNPEGKSLLRNAYRPWYYKKHIEEIEGIGIERDLAGLPVLTAPENLDLWNDDDPKMVMLKTNAEELVRNIRRDNEEGILLPHGWDLKLLASGSNRQFDTNAVINRYDNRIAITMLSDLVLIGGDKTGSFALADTKKSLLSTSLSAILNIIADVFNKYGIPKLFGYNNFPDITEYPVLVPGQVETPDLKEVAVLLRAMGVDIEGDLELQNYLRQISGMPVMDKDDFEAKQKAKEEAAKDALKTKQGERDLKDTAQKDLEQNDMNYTGQ